MTNCGARKDLGQCRFRKDQGAEAATQPSGEDGLQPRAPVPGPCSRPRRGQEEQRSPKVTPPLRRAQQMPGPGWHLEMPSKSGHAPAPGTLLHH